MAEKVTRQVDVKVAAPGADAAKKSLTGFGQALKDLSSAGKMSGLTGDSGIVGLLKGAGVAAAVKFTADAVKKGAEAWGEYKAGTLNAADAISKMAASLPLVGSVFEATFTVLDVFTGKAERAAKAARELAIANATFDRDAAQFDAFAKMEAFASGVSRPDLVKDPAKQLILDREQIDLAKEKMRLYDQAKAQLRELDIKTIANLGNRGPGDPLFQNESKRLQGIIDTTAMSEGERSRVTRADEANAAAIKKLALEGFGNIRDVMGEALAAAKKFKEKSDGWLDEKRFQKLDAEISFAERVAAFEASNQAAKLDAQLQADEERKRDGIISRYAPAVSGRFLTGATPSNPNAPEEKTARNTDMIAKKQDETLQAIKDLARAIRENPATIGLMR